MTFYPSEYNKANPANATGPFPPECNSCVIEAYQQLVNITRQMEEAARQENWEATLSLGQSYVHEVEVLRNKANLQPNNKAEKEICSHLLHQVLMHDAAVRDAVSPEMKRLSQLLHTRSQQKKMVKAYSGMKLAG